MNHVIILAAGQGQRMASKKDKMLLPICGRPLIYYPLTAFNDHPEIDTITVIANKTNKEQLELAIKTYHFPKVKKVILGGLQRQNSVEKGLKYLEKTAKPDDIIIVHNGANPLPSHEEISFTIKNAQEHGASIVGHFVASTVKEVDDRHVIKTHDRKKLFAAETPQAATFKIIKKALDYTIKNKLLCTDEAMMFEEINQKTTYIKAHENNFKITTQADYAKLRTILGDLPEDFRIGIGQDSHFFEEKKKGLTLAGIFLKDELKLKANSDGDVVFHAIFNALSQAIGDKSLGFYADKECEKGIKDSKKYIQIILKKIKKQGFKINNLGIMIEAGNPKIDPLVPKMKKSLSPLLDLNSRRIGITATSGEECTVFGEGLGIQCFAIASLVKEG
jgi:2-C-methyl-D-erythritol 4-phosphate cytidylyltransferase/2-C-methyl-D-erythritol 2,4-cyclodiphosphate synthase